MPLLCFILLSSLLTLSSCDKESNPTEVIKNEKSDADITINTRSGPSLNTGGDLWDCSEPHLDPDCIFEKHVIETITVPLYCDVDVEYDLWKCTYTTANGGLIVIFVIENVEWQMNDISCQSIVAYWSQLVDTDPNRWAELKLVFESVLRQAISDLELISYVENNRPATNCNSTTYSVSSRYFLSSCIQVCATLLGNEWTKCGFGCCIESTHYCYNTTTNKVDKEFTRIDDTGEGCTVAVAPVCSGFLIGECMNLCNFPFGPM